MSKSKKVVPEIMNYFDMDIDGRKDLVCHSLDCKNLRCGNCLISEDSDFLEWEKENAHKYFVRGAEKNGIEKTTEEPKIDALLAVINEQATRIETLETENKHLKNHAILLGRANLATLDAKAVIDKEIDDIITNPHNRYFSAVATLEHLGYEHVGGVEWKPPIGGRPQE